MGKFNLSQEFISSYEWINLRDLWTKDLSLLPNWINSLRVVYYIRNKVNGKGYVGQAKVFVNRLITASGIISSHYNTYKLACINGINYYPILYKALCKYKSRSFEVTILESNVDNLNECEKYWIKELHTYKSEWGYNMTYGGEDCSQLTSKSSNDKRVNTQIKLYGRVMGQCLTPEVIEKRNITQKCNNNGVLPFNTIKLYNRLKIERGGDYMAPCRTPEANKARIESDKANHGGVMGWNTKSEIDKLIQRNKDPQLINKANIGRLFSDINFTINKLILLKLELNLNNYLLNRNKYTLEYIKDYISLLRQDPRWTPEMEIIFQNI